MNIYNYNKSKNLTVFSCWALINTVLTVAYVAELFKGNRTLEYFTLFMLFTWLPLVISYATSLIIGRGELRIKYTVSIMYLVFYVFVQTTSNNILTFVYIMPMICVLIVYDDLTLIDLTCGVSFLINLLYIDNVCSKSTRISEDMIVFYEIQLAVLFLCSVFLHGATKVVAYGDRKLEKLNSEVSIDELTSAYNRHFLTRLLKKLNFDKQNIALAVIDLDSFKSINDTYGHKFGDLVLRKLSSIVRDYTDLKDNTYFCRTGGDEFIIISTELNNDKLTDLALQISNRIYETRLNYNDKDIQFSVSIGVAASLDDNAKSYSKLYELADSRLYAVKHKGKGAVANK